ncbi:ras GEF [Ceratobasidium sp. AG-I]|nr:ras GEF [Ceratobasidium sp. AG-I]
MSRGANEQSSVGGPGMDGRVKPLDADAPSIKSSSNSSGKSTKSKTGKEKRPRRNHSPPAMFSHTTFVKPKPTTPSKAKSIAPSVRSGGSGDTVGSGMTARANDTPSMYLPPPLPTKKSKELRGVSKSTLDLRTPTRDTFSFISGSSGSGSGGAMSVVSGARSESSTGFFGPSTASSVTTYEDTRQRPRQPSLPSPSDSLPPTPLPRDRVGDHAPARVRSVRSAPRVQTPTTRDGNTSDFSAQSHRLADLPMPPQKVLPAASPAAEYVLGVIGSKGCGKSTLIKHAIAGVDVEESRIVAASADGPTMTLACTTIARGAARILEINADELLDLSEIESEKWRLWPDGFPKLGGVAICFDANDQRSYAQAKQVLAGLSNSFPDPSFYVIFVGCKSDSLEDSSLRANELSADRAAELGSQYGAKFVQTSTRTPEGISHMLHTIQWILNHIATARGAKRIIIVPRPKKTSAAAGPAPASERPLKSALARTRSAGDLVSAWMSDSSDAGVRTLTPAPAPAPVPAIAQPEPEEVMSSGRDSIGQESLLSFGFPKVPTTVPTPTRSDEAIVPVRLPTPKLNEEVREVRAPPLQLKIDGTPSEAPPRKPPAPLCMRWATTEQLIDKLLFAGVSDDEPWYIFNFFLTYRLFMTPRTVLLSFQKRLRDLDDFPSDPIFAGFVQQKLCELLLMWIEDYPNDFASPGAPSALTAVVRTACDNIHLMYYGSEFTYFLDELPSLADDASSWAFISADTPIEEDESIYDFDLDFNQDFSFGGGHEIFGSNGQGLLGKNGDTLLVRETDAQGLFDPAYNIAAIANGVPASSAEDRFELDRSPPPTSEFGRRLTRGESLNDDTVTRGTSPDARRGGPPALRALVSVATQLLDYDPMVIAEEITRIETNLFLKIKPRDWVRRSVKEDKLGKPKSIIEMNAFFDRIGKWVMSIVVSFNRASDRAKLVEHLCLVARDLRKLNNYSSLRAFHVGINCVCEIGDVVQSQVDGDTWKRYQSADKLLRVNENHLLYRMAVKNTFGAGIPSLEVHSSDLSRIAEMPSSNMEGQIHWAKFTHLGNNIHEIHAFQERIREDGGYAFEPNMPLAKLILDCELMDMETIYERCSQLDKDLQNGYPVPMQTSTASKLHKYLRR